MSSSVLSQRLTELGDAGIVETDTDGAWRLTREGKRLADALGPLQAWAGRWARRRR